MKKRFKYYLICFLLIGPCYFLSAQTKKIDSLLVLVKNSQTDTNKASLLNQLASLFIYVDINKANIYSDSAFQLSKKISFPLGIAEAFNSKGIILSNQGNYPMALKYLEASNTLYKTLKNKTGLVRTIGNIGIIYDLQGEYDKAMIYYQQALELNLQLNNQRGIGYSYNNIGAIYHNRGNFSQALDYYFKGLKAREKAADATGICGSYTNIGLLYSSLENYDRALFYYQKAIDLIEKYNDKLTASTLYSDIGFCYNRKKKYVTAEKFYKKALQLSIENKDSYSTILIFNSIGENFQDLHLIDSAQTYYQKCYDLSMVLNSKPDVAISLQNMGTIAFEKNEYSKALSFIKKTEEIAKETKDLSLLKNVYSYTSKCFEKLNKSEMALIYYKKYIAARDSISNEENTKKNIQTEMNYEFDKKETATKLEQEKKAEIAAAENKKQKVIIWSVSGILLLVLGFAVFAYRSYLQKQKANIEITKQKHIIEDKQKEILDSIRYALRIQRSLLPTEKYIDKNLNRLMKR